MKGKNGLKGDEYSSDEGTGSNAATGTAQASGLPYKRVMLLLAEVQDEVEALVARSRSRLTSVVEEELAGMLKEAMATLVQNAPSVKGSQEMVGSDTASEPQGLGHRKARKEAELGAGKAIEALSVEHGVPNSEKKGGVAMATAIQSTTEVTGKGQSIQEQAKEREGEGEVSSATRREGEAASGMVHLMLPVGQPAAQALRLVDQLCHKPQITLQRLVGNHKEGMELWVNLREPVDIRGLLLEMENVADVYDVSTNKRDEGLTLGVRLKEPVGANAS